MQMLAYRNDGFGNGTRLSDTHQPPPEGLNGPGRAGKLLDNTESDKEDSRTHDSEQLKKLWKAYESGNGSWLLFLWESCSYK